MLKVAGTERVESNREVSVKVRQIRECVENGWYGNALKTIKRERFESGSNRKRLGLKALKAAATERYECYLQVQ